MRESYFNKLFFKILIIFTFRESSWVSPFEWTTWTKALIFEQRGKKIDLFLLSIQKCSKMWHFVSGDVSLKDISGMRTSRECGHRGNTDIAGMQTSRVCGQRGSGNVVIAVVRTLWTSWKWFQTILTFKLKGKNLPNFA